MVLMKLFTGSSGDTDTENRPMDMAAGQEGGGGVGRVTWILTLPNVK